MKTKIPPFISRLSFLLALVGAFVGVVISWNDGDDLGWAFLRGAVLFLAFGMITRWWLGTMAKAWLESRIESLQTKPKNETRPMLGRATN